MGLPIKRLEFIFPAPKAHLPPRWTARGRGRQFLPPPPASNLSTFYAFRADEMTLRLMRDRDFEFIRSLVQARSRIGLGLDKRALGPACRGQRRRTPNPPSLPAYRRLRHPPAAPAEIARHLNAIPTSRPFSIRGPGRVDFPRPTIVSAMAIRAGRLSARRPHRQPGAAPAARPKRRESERSAGWRNRTSGPSSYASGRELAPRTSSTGCPAPPGPTAAPGGDISRPRSPGRSCLPLSLRPYVTRPAAHELHRRHPAHDPDRR